MAERSEMARYAAGGGRSVTELWRRLETYLRSEFPVALESLNSPVDKERLALAEKTLAVAFPDELKESLLIHDGQPQITGFEPSPIALIPQTDEATWGLFAPLELIVERSEIYSDDDPEVAEYYEFDGPVRWDGAWRMIVFVDPGSGDRIAVDLNPPPEGNLGQIVAINHDPGQLIVLAPTYRDWFEELVRRYESGRYVIKDVEGALSAVDLEY